MQFVLELIDKVTGPAKEAAGSAGELMKKLEDLGGHAGGADGALGGLGEATEGLDAILPGLGVAVGVAAAALVGLGAAAYEATKFALELSEVEDKTQATFAALAGGKAAGAATIQMLDDMRGSLGMTREAMIPFAQQLMGMGLQGEALKGQLTALASVKAIGIQGGEEAYVNVLKKLSGGAALSSRELANLYKSGVNVNDIAKTMGMSTAQLEASLKKGGAGAAKFQAALQAAVTAKGADALAAQAENLGNQWDIFKETASKGFMQAMKPLVDILKVIIPKALSVLQAIAAKVFPYIKIFMLQIGIAGLKLYIGLKPTIAKLQELFASHKDGHMLEDVIIGIANGLGFVAKMVAWGVIAFAQLVGSAMVAFDAISAAIQGAIAWFGSLWDSITNLFGGGEGIGSKFVDGLIGGITAGVSGAIDAAKNLAKGAMDAVKSVLGIHSPSAVMMKMGAHTAAGFTAGVDSGAPDAQASMGAMAAPSAAAGPMSGGGGGKQITITVEAGAISLHGGSGQGTVELTEQALSQLFEKFALEMGA